MHTLFDSYPRVRRPLSREMEAFFLATYVESRAGRNVSSRITHGLESWMHRQIAAWDGPGAVLEIGAGTLNHLPYEPAATLYDIVEPFADLYRDSPRLSRIRAIHADIEDIPLDRRYDRILSVAALEHVLDLPRLVARSARLMAEDGLFLAGLPAEGGFLWRLAWGLGKQIPFYLRTGLDYGEMVRHEHVSTLPEILAILRHVFRDVRVRRFPLPGLHASLYAHVEARAPDPAAIARLDPLPPDPVR